MFKQANASLMIGLNFFHLLTSNEKPVQEVRSGTQSWWWSKKGPRQNGINMEMTK
jgi:hypothetical protein